MRRRIMLSIVIAGCAAFLTAALPAPAEVIYVDADATGDNNGSSWADAYNYLQDALVDANASERPVEIRVAQGTYKPDEDSLHPDGTSDREATFQLINGLRLKGGYAGLSQPDPNARDIEKYQTVLSGDLDANDVDLAGAEWEDIDNLIRWGSRKDNSYSVVTGSGTDQTAVLDGFTTTAGQADGTDGPWDSPQVNGAGMYNHHGNPTISNCTFLRNTTCGYDRRTHGAGLFNSDSNPVLRNCSFIENIAFGANGLAKGGGLFDVNSAPILTNCIFRNNIVTGFDSDYYGGAAYEDNSRSTFANCMFIQNSGEGGAIQFCSHLRLANCTFAGNGTAIGCDYWGCGQPQTISLEAVNCIIWDNIGELPVAGWFEIRITYSDVRDGWAGEGNIDADPLFVDVDRGNYRLHRSSPCVNAGDNSAVGQGEVDLDGQPRIVNDRVDMGAYELGMPRIIYVDDSADGDNDGSSWADAYNYLQDALMMALDGDEIRVAQGVYKPDQFVLSDRPCRGREETFQLKNSVTLKGGYAGFGEPAPDARNIELYHTILTGDLAGDDAASDNPADLLEEPTRIDNSYHVVTATDCNQTAILDGFTITAGNANGPTEAQKWGGGLYDGNPTVMNCIFINNSASFGGGGIYFSGPYYNNSPGGLVTDCTITHNAASIGGGIYGCSTLSNCVISANAATVYSGGGVHLGQGCDTTATDCVFSSNSAVTYGGGVSLGVSGSTPIFTRCTFIANSADASGGGVASDGCTCGTYPEFHRCAFIANSAGSNGGGLYNFGYALAKMYSCLVIGNTAGNNGGGICDGTGYDDGGSLIVNCTLTHNTASEQGGGIYYGTYSGRGRSIANSILWYNSDSTGQSGNYSQICVADGTATVSSMDHCCIQGWTGGGTGNIGTYPLFVDADGADNVPGTQDDNLHLQPDSPCIDKGRSSAVPPDSNDLDGNPRIMGGSVDMGAYEYYEYEPPALVAHWKLDESEGDTAKDSAGTNDGALHDSPQWQPYGGRLEGALLFDGENDYVDCGNSPTFDITAQITVAAWANFSFVNMEWQTVIAKGDSAWRLSTARNYRRYHFAVTGGPPWNYINGDIEVEAHEWHHVCGTYDGANLRLYIDGVEDPAGPVPELNGVTTDDYDVYIGENQERPGRYWDGLIDDVRVYNYALTPAQVFNLCKPGVLYVDADAHGANNGSSWADAFKRLQDALAAANGTEIRVAQGAYRPDRGTGITPGDRQATFHLKNGVAIKGGYAGFGTPHPDARDIEVYETILSGDIAGNDVDVNDPEELAWEPTHSENSYRVVTGSQTNETAIIDGFTITAGYANYYDFSQCNGAGMFNDHGSPTILNCTFIANFAGNDDGGGLGGGMYNYHGSPKLTNCRFIYNASIALDGGEGAGGAMGNWSSNPTLTNCIFTGNIAGRDGGAMWNYESNPVLVNCIFSGNLAREGGSGSFGGGMWSYGGSASLINCVFAGNTARSSQIGSGGGGIWAAQGNVKLINCTFNGNVAGRGGAISGDYPYESTFLLSNCILWNDKPQEIYTPTTLPVVTYSDVQRGWPGQGNINADPCFLAPGHWDNDLWVNGDYHLKSLGWRWDAARAQWTFDRVTSRCIDAGNPGSPLADEPLTIPDDPNNDWGCNLRIDMGAYGGTAEASIPPYDWAILADLNNDGAVDWLDFVCTGSDWLKTAPNQPCDLNRNGDVNPADLDLFADDWLKTTIWRE